jgi:hypothetical protein
MEGFLVICEASAFAEQTIEPEEGNDNTSYLPPIIQSANLTCADEQAPLVTAAQSSVPTTVEQTERGRYKKYSNEVCNLFVDYMVQHPESTTTTASLIYAINPQTAHEIASISGEQWNTESTKRRRPKSKGNTRS